MAQNDDAIVRLPVDAAGVVLVAEEINRPGNELNAGGVVYGEAPTSNAACAPFDEEAWLENPSLADIAHTSLGFERGDTPWGVYGTFHPTIRAIRVNADGAAPFVVRTAARHDRPNGPRYVAFALPAGTESAELDLVDADGKTVTRADRQFR